MISRQMTEKLATLATQFPVVGILGPRQSGKTTLAKSTFAKYAYVSMEDPDVKALAISDPRRFFKAYQNDHGLVIDEIQEVPTLLSYMQGIVDQEYRPGAFIITGSQNILLLKKVTQTLAGRIALLTLLPLSVDELRTAQKLPATLEELLVVGCYPRPYNQPIPTADWFSHYITTYVERDVRQLINIDNLLLFQNFLKLCAGRVGQLLNYSTLANDCGISLNTAKAWISILVASYIIHLVPPYYKNFNKRVIKSPKLHFYDTGLVCSLLGITDHKQLYTHYMRGHLFESFVISECMKYRFNYGQNPNLYFWRDVQGHEVDCVLERADKLIPIEIKSSITIASDFFNGLVQWQTISGTEKQPAFVVYAGTHSQEREQANVVAWDHIKGLIDAHQN